MAEFRKVFLQGADGSTLAELLVEDDEEGWITGRVIARTFPPEIDEALAWYDEVVRDQMLSYLDEATAAVERFGLRAYFPDGSARRVCSLHVGPGDAVSFRISPVPPPPMWPSGLSTVSR